MDGFIDRAKSAALKQPGGMMTLTERESPVITAGRAAGEHFTDIWNRANEMGADTPTGRMLGIGGISRPASAPAPSTISGVPASATPSVPTSPGVGMSGMSDTTRQDIMKTAIAPPEPQTNPFEGMSESERYRASGYGIRQGETTATRVTPLDHNRTRIEAEGLTSMRRPDPVAEINAKVDALVDQITGDPGNRSVTGGLKRSAMAGLTALRQAQLSGAYGLSSRKLDLEDRRMENEEARAARKEESQNRNAIERERLQFEIDKFAKTNNMKDPLNVMKLAASIAPKKKLITYDTEGNQQVSEEPNVQAGLSLLIKMGYDIPKGLTGFQGGIQR